MSCGASVFVFVVLLGSVFAAPSDLVDDGEYLSSNDNYVQGIIPGLKENNVGINHQPKLSDFFDEKNENYKLLSKYMGKGYTMKGLTFNIFNENMRNSARALYRLMSESNFDLLTFSDWATSNINTEMFTYVLNVYLLNSNIYSHESMDPPFILNPNYFVNSETIYKALHLTSNDGFFNYQEAEVNQYYRTDDLITINTNYSNWYTNENHCDELNYFREDIGLNSYYYGLNALYPFWMTDEELSKMSPKYTEHYYFAHQQLFARYLLEHEHLEGKLYVYENCKLNNYNPNLVHKNGLLFSLRSKHDSKEMNHELNLIKSHEIALSEFISRGYLLIGGQFVNLTDENYIDLLVKVIRVNFEGPKTASLIRTANGYGSQFKQEKYMPAPTALHHFETTLRDPLYWTMINRMLNFFELFRTTTKPINISEYITHDFAFSDASFSIFSLFEYYQFSLNNAIKQFGHKENPLVISARQRRINHKPFTLNFTINSKHAKDVALRLFLGPSCTENECWKLYSRFYQLDVSKVHLVEGQNIISWSPDNSISYSSDDLFNLENKGKSKSHSKYNLIKFPKSLAIPKGNEDGLPVTLFAMVTPIEDDVEIEAFGTNQIPHRIDDKPIGFPFHNEVIAEPYSGSNYKFFNLSITHIKHHNENNGLFSSYLN